MSVDVGDPVKETNRQGHGRVLGSSLPAALFNHGTDQCLASELKRETCFSASSSCRGFRSKEKNKRNVAFAFCTVLAFLYQNYLLPHFYFILPVH